MTSDNLNAWFSPAFKQEQSGNMAHGLHKSNWNFKTRYSVHIKDFINNRGKSNYTNHLNNFNLKYDIIDDSLEILLIENNYFETEVLVEIYILKACHNSKKTLWMMQS